VLLATPVCVLAPAARHAPLVMRRAHLLALVALGWLCAGPAARAQLSSPISSDSHVSTDGNRFLQRHAGAHDAG